jgi:hypothetical protein
MLSSDANVKSNGDANNQESKGSLIELWMTISQYLQVNDSLFDI